VKASVAGPPGRQSRTLRHSVYVQVAGIVLILPMIMLLCLIIVAPFGVVVWQSFIEKLTGSVGLANYVWLLQQPDFFAAFQRGVYIAVGSVVLEVMVAVPLAILLNQPIPGRGILRAATTLPWAIPTVTVATGFLWLSDTNFGLFNQLGLSLGVLREPISVLGSPQLALPALTVAHAWKGLPLVFIVILSSLQSLPSEWLEAAKVDGAWWGAQFRYVLLPHLAPSIILASVLSAVTNFSFFDLTFLLTGGGPAGTTTTPPLLLYLQQFVAFDSGRAAAIGVAIFFAGVLALGGLYLAESFDARLRG
jgi:multiple sugar transport system permease protein